MSLLERCPHFRGCYVQASMELGPEDASLLERCPHFRGCYVQASMELGPEDASLLERCPHFRGLCTGFNRVHDFFYCLLAPCSMHMFNHVCCLLQNANVHVVYKTHTVTTHLSFTCEYHVYESLGFY